ncbi:ORF6N domain-containing protein [Ochrobactrum sp. AP1BH01-1]|uniref:ORF6N domain-containing protein n=1 Tax=Ochrobactrum sp. AP1BH01-1 TaxID=2823874 RepID=UPI001B39C946|nr:ORF6N domain-containing protein [Ochrobactrum sp. AP1BH01-1]MBQ0707869.1 ORF6N domain-containing protein [Ochrobactrum sp. AP1BH01-1]
MRFSPLEYQGKRVLTTERLATAFETDADNIAMNFSRNKDRFVEGVHFFKVTGTELKEIKNSLTFSGSVGKNARSLLLWTERGVARHAKILETDIAWEIYEKLEDTYFSVRQQRQMTPAEMFLHSAQTMYAIEQRQAAQAAAIQTIGAQVERVEKAQTVMSSRPANAEAITHIRKRISKMLGLSAETIDTVLRQSPYTPKPAGTVKNSREEAEGSTYVVYWQKDITALFDRFASECEQVTAQFFTHPFVDRKFRMTRKAK